MSLCLREFPRIVGVLCHVATLWMCHLTNQSLGQEIGNSPLECFSLLIPGCALFPRSWWVRTRTVMASWPISLLMRSPFAAWPLTPVVRDFSASWDGCKGSKSHGNVSHGLEALLVPLGHCRWPAPWSVGCVICLFWKFQTLATLLLWWEGGDSAPVPLLRNSWGNPVGILPAR